MYNSCLSGRVSLPCPGPRHSSQHYMLWCCIDMRECGCRLRVWVRRVCGKQVATRCHPPALSGLFPFPPFWHRATIEDVPTWANVKRMSNGPFFRTLGAPYRPSLSHPAPAPPPAHSLRCRVRRVPLRPGPMPQGCGQRAPRASDWGCRFLCTVCGVSWPYIRKPSGSIAVGSTIDHLSQRTGAITTMVVIVTTTASTTSGTVWLSEGLRCR